MREPKFRAWDKKAKTWRVVTSLVWYKPDTGKAGVCGVVIVTDSNHDQFMPIEDVEVVEYTGLKDKNGKEVYELDVVKMHYFSEGFSNGGAYEQDNEVVGIIEYRPDFATWVVSTKDKDYTICEYLEEPSEELDVIGNTPENPGLIK